MTVPAKVGLPKSTRQFFSQFLASKNGNVATMFGIAAVPLVAAVSFATTFAARNEQATRAQTALDGAALAAVQVFQATGVSAEQTAANARATAQRALQVYSAKIGDIVSNSTISVDSASQIVSISYASSVTNNLSSWVGHSLPVNVKSNAKMNSGSAMTPVCILITNPSDGHTLLSGGTSKVDIYNCMVQVNTDDWDAVQADNTSYIHIHQNDSGDQNCYVGSIHFGDVQPPKQPTCTMLPDPYASLALPAAATATCADTTSYSVTSATTFRNATYGGQIVATGADVVFDAGASGGAMTFCGKVQLQGGTATFMPGAYYFNGGQFIVKNGRASTTVNASQAAFAFTGRRAGFQMQGGTLNMSPATTGPLAGFQMYWAMSNNAAGDVSIKNANVTSSGVIYLAGAVMDLDDTNFTHLGSLVADKFRPDGASVVKITGDRSASTPAPTGGRLVKATGTPTPTLFR